MSYPNLDLLERAAAMLQPLLPEIVFVGGCAEWGRLWSQAMPSHMRPLLLRLS